MASRLLSEIQFGAFLTYSPRGTSEISRRSRLWRDNIKSGDPESLRRAVERLAEEFDTSDFAAVLGPDVTLVPVPRSGLLAEGALWPGRRVADALQAAGFGSEVVPCLRRHTAVRKSAFQQPGDRPDATKHFETMEVEPLLIAGQRITLVDDFVTKGNTLLAGASLLVQAYPDKPVAGFALVRTMGLQPNVENIVDPCVGRIRNVYGDADRQP